MDIKPGSPVPTQHWLAHKHIVIAGAGMSGISFALSLCKQWPSSTTQLLPDDSKPQITIFERDSQHDRIGGGRQGYTLSLRTDGGRGGGIQVLDDLGLYEKVLAESASVEGKGGFVMWDKDINELFRPRTSASNGTKRNLKGIRVKRNTLQRVLADAVHELEDQNSWRVKIEWGRAVTGTAWDSTHSQMQAIFDDGTSLACDIVIAADGASSKILSNVRPQNKLDFAQAICIAGTARFSTIEDVPKPFDRDWGMILGWTGVGIFVAPVDETSVLWSVSYRSKEPRERLKQPLSEVAAQSLIGEARGLVQPMGSIVRNLIDATDTSTLLIVNCMDRPSFSHNLERDGRVLFLGDANHAVSPFAGNGANMALIDGWDLAKFFLSSSSFEEAVMAYDKTVSPRTNPVLAQSHKGIDIAHSAGFKSSMFWVLLKILNLLFGEEKGK